MEEFYLINYTVDGKNVIVFPDLEQPMRTMIKYLVPENTKCVIIKNVIDIDFRFINAYSGDFTLDHGSVSEPQLDIIAAKTIFVDKIREMRDPLFGPLDVQFMRALEQGDQNTVTEVSSKKQVLRDITSLDFDSATDLASLKALWPSDVLGNNPFL